MPFINELLVQRCILFFLICAVGAPGRKRSIILQPETHTRTAAGIDQMIQPCEIGLIELRGLHSLGFVAGDNL